MAALLNRPFDPCLGLFRHHLKVPYLSLEEQTEDAPLHAIHVRRKEAIVNAHILLLHDQTTTGHALNTSAAALKQSKAAAVYGLSLVNETLSL